MGLVPNEGWIPDDSVHERERASELGRRIHVEEIILVEGRIESFVVEKFVGGLQRISVDIDPEDVIIQLVDTDT